MKELIEQIVKMIVEQPEDVEITEIHSESMISLELRVAKSDMGRVIGHQGKMIAAIRTILNATRVQKETRQVLKIIE